MSEFTLSDLDELVLAVRDRTSRTYIHEAIIAYRGRAYRAAVVSTWVAVAFDIISKIRELANQGERAAITFVADLDTAVAAKNVRKLQEIENDLLNKALNEFEFLGRREADDLERLKADRNECAHPAFTATGTLFAPSPELVRAHIVHAIESLLMHPPVQGKSALARLKADILQPSFPIDQDQVTRFLDDKYLNRSKVTLVETMITVLLKALVRGSDVDLKPHSIPVIRCLRAIADVKPDVYERMMPLELGKVCEGTDDAQIGQLFPLMNVDHRVWTWLDEPSRMRLRRLVGTSVAHTAVMSAWPSVAPAFVHAASVSELRADAIAAFRSLPPLTQETVVRFFPRAAWAEDVARLYRSASSFRDAEALGNSLLLPMAQYLSGPQIASVLEAVCANSQIWNASGTPDVLEKLFDLTAAARSDALPSWQEAVRFFVSRATTLADHYAYPKLRGRLEAIGWWPPAPAPSPPPTISTGGAS